jgi:predicted acylesterase/phospholipase RssA
MTDQQSGATAPGDAPASSEDESQLFLVLEGGGAKGIAHIAAWEALEGLVRKPGQEQPDIDARLGLRRYRLTGIAGTSAGAIAAAFIAAGAKASDLLDDKGRLPLCSALHIRRFHDLFGVPGWRSIANRRWLGQPFWGLARAIRQLNAEEAPGLNIPPKRRVRPRNRSPRWKLRDFLALGIVAAPLLGLVIAAMYAIGVFRVPAGEALSFIVFWGGAMVFFYYRRVALRTEERRASERGNRDFSLWQRVAYHPLTTLAFALAFTLVILAAATLYQPWRTLYEAGVRSHFLVVIGLYVSAATLGLFSLATWIRRLIKAYINPPPRRGAIPERRTPWTIGDILTLGMVFAPILGFVAAAMDTIGVFRQPAVEALFLIVFWIVAKGLFHYWRVALRTDEALGRERGNRHFSLGKRVAYHPLTTLAFALVFTIIIVTVVTLHQPLRDLYVWLVRSHILVVIGLNVVAAMLALGSLAHWIRNLIKGNINTQSLRIDLDVALRTIITKDKELGADGQTYVWGSKPRGTKAQEAVRRRLLENPSRSVTFRDLKDATGLNLSVVAAETIRNEVKVFSTGTHDNMSVARAVAASMAIPFAFEPVPHGRGILMDGGLISSIPAWVYRRHRNIDPDCRILAIGIEPHYLDSWIPNFHAVRRAYYRKWKRRGLGEIGRAIMVMRFLGVSLRWPLRLITNVMATAAYGARALDLDASDRLDTFSLQPDVGLLDFDLEPDFARAEVSTLREIATIEIKNRLWVRRNAFLDVAKYVEKELRAVRNVGADQGRVRVMWSERDGTADAMRIKYVHGFKKDEFDDRLVLPFGSSMTAWAGETETSQFATVDVLELMLEEPKNRYRKFVKWADLQWCWAVPVTHPVSGKLCGVLAVESDQILSFFGDELGLMGAARSGQWLDGDTLKRDDERKIVGPDPHEEDDVMREIEGRWIRSVQNGLIIPFDTKNLRERRKFRRYRRMQRRRALGARLERAWMRWQKS